MGNSTEVCYIAIIFTDKMNRKYNILLVDDDNDIIEFLQYNLQNAGFNVRSCYNALDALEIVKDFLPDLILLDVMMPEMDGIELCEKLREIPKLNQTIIAFLTARGEDYSQIAGFEAGADDYITKPIKPKLLVSRVNALLKRSLQKALEKNSHHQANVIEHRGILIDKDQYTLTVDNRLKNIPKKEFEILFLLMSLPGKVFSREQIYKEIWGTDVVVGDRTIDVHIRKLREIIGDNKIQTIKGIGYKLNS
jgi:two-component system alkaline phosphatase synthesis response regulator PhoP